MNEYREQLKQAIPGGLEKCERIVGMSCIEWQVNNM